MLDGGGAGRFLTTYKTIMLYKGSEQVYLIICWMGEGLKGLTTSNNYTVVGFGASIFDDMLDGGKAGRLLTTYQTIILL